MSWGRGLRYGLALLLVGTLVWLAWRPQPVLVDAVVVSRGDVVDALEAQGQTRVRDRYEITAPIQAQARRLRLEVGDAVAQGDVLVVLDPTPAPALDPRAQAQAQALVGAAGARVQAAREDLAAAEKLAAQEAAEARRMRTLFERGMVSAEVAERAETAHLRALRDAASARFTIATAEHELSAARAALALGSAVPSKEAAMTLTAPVAGVVLRRQLESARTVQPGEVLLEIGDPAALEVRVDVLSADAVRLREGMAVALLRWGEAAPLEGRVRRVEPGGFTKVSALGVEEQRVWVTVDLTSPRAQWERLGDAYRVHARFIVEVVPDALRIPASSLFRHGEGWAVFRVEGDRVRLTPVRIGLRGGPWVVLREGLGDHDEVVVHPDRDLADGSRIRRR